MKNAEAVDRRLPRRGIRWSRVKLEIPFYTMLLPALILLIIYRYIPMAGIIIAFQKFDVVKGLFGQQTWVGWNNFTYLFNLPDFKRAMSNTVIIASAKIICGLITPMVFALLLNEIKHVFYKRSVQTLIYLPHFLSWVILAGTIVTLLSPSTGLINSVIKAFGGNPVFFLADNKWFPVVLVVTDIWKEFGWGTIIYLATLSGIDPGLYESAQIDGANRLQQTRYITLPGISHIVGLLTILSLARVLNAGFDQVFNLYSPLVYESGDILDTLIYRVGLVQANFGLSTALGLFKSAVSLVLTVIMYWIAYKVSDYRLF